MYIYIYMHVCICVKSSLIIGAGRTDFLICYKEN